MSEVEYVSPSGRKLKKIIWTDEDELIPMDKAVEKREQLAELMEEDTARRLHGGVPETWNINEDILRQKLTIAYGIKERLLAGVLTDLLQKRKVAHGEAAVLSREEVESSLNEALALHSRMEELDKASSELEAARKKFSEAEARVRDLAGNLVPDEGEEMTDEMDDLMSKVSVLDPKGTTMSLEDAVMGTMHDTQGDFNEQLRKRLEDLGQEQGKNEG